MPTPVYRAELKMEVDNVTCDLSKDKIRYIGNTPAIELEYPPCEMFGNEFNIKVLTLLSGRIIVCTNKNLANEYYSNIKSIKDVAEGKLNLKVKIEHTDYASVRSVETCIYISSTKM